MSPIPYQPTTTPRIIAACLFRIFSPLALFFFFFLFIFSVSHPPYITLPHNPGHFFRPSTPSLFHTFTHYSSTLRPPPFSYSLFPFLSLSLVSFHLPHTSVALGSLSPLDILLPPQSHNRTILARTPPTEINSLALSNHSPAPAASNRLASPRLSLCPQHSPWHPQRTSSSWPTTRQSWSDRTNDLFRALPQPRMVTCIPITPTFLPLHRQTPFSFTV